MPGSKLLDFSVDLSAGAAHDCPPISHYRLVLRERGRLVRLNVGQGDALMPGVAVAMLATDTGDTADDPRARLARVTVASIVFHAEGWGGR